jgi:hypothetical protein
MGPLAHDRLCEGQGTRRMSVSKLAAKSTTVTGRKLDWLKCVAFDPRLKSYPYDFKVAFQIAQHVNERTGNAFVSDETIADKTGGGSVRNVWNARHRLRDAGWLTWRRTRTASVYSLNYGRVNGVLDMITVSSEARHEKRRKRATAERAMSAANSTRRPKPPTSADERCITPRKTSRRDMNHSSGLDARDMNHSSDQDMNCSADIHLRGTP